ncbi:MAG: hypothetical protein NTX44_15330 [Ignavibacteriales bacterium]|nr:hypothetical protein [Ignavibacteriales bacterium]
METIINSKNEMFRHSIATLAYRAAKTLRNAPENFATFRIDAKSRTSVEILTHMGDLIVWALSMAKGKGIWHESTPQDWESEAARFFDSIRQFDTYLASGSTIACPLEKLFQGPIADALTHVGQLAMLRRLAGAPIIGENYFVADIIVGRVGPEQSQPRKTFG